MSIWIQTDQDWSTDLSKDLIVGFEAILDIFKHVLLAEVIQSEQIIFPFNPCLPIILLDRVQLFLWPIIV